MADHAPLAWCSGPALNNSTTRSSARRPQSPSSSAASSPRAARRPLSSAVRPMRRSPHLITRPAVRRARGRAQEREPLHDGLLPPAAWAHHPAAHARRLDVHRSARQHPSRAAGGAAATQGDLDPAKHAVATKRARHGRRAARGARMGPARRPRRQGIQGHAPAEAGVNPVCVVRETGKQERVRARPTLQSSVTSERGKAARKVRDSKRNERACDATEHRFIYTRSYCCAPGPRGRAAPRRRPATAPARRDGARRR